MRKSIFIVSIIALLLISAKGSPLRRLTIINKSGVPIAVSLRTPDRTRQYYLPVPEGDRQHPTEVTFTIIVDEYRMRVYYLEKSPAYTGLECRDSISSRLHMLRNTRVTVVECDRSSLVPRGEPTMIKMGREPCIE